MREEGSAAARARRFVGALRASLAAAVLSGCGVGGVAAASAGGGGGGGTEPPPIPASSIVAIENMVERDDERRVVSGIVVFDYRLSHVTTRVDVTPEYFLDGVWRPMTTVTIAGTQPTTALDPKSGRKGEPFKVAWNSLIDLGVNDINGDRPFSVRARIRFDPSPKTADVRKTNVFLVDNRRATTAVSRLLSPVAKATSATAVPSGLKLVPQGLYVANSVSDVVERIDPVTGAVERFVGRGEGVLDAQDEVRTLPPSGERIASQPRSLLGLTADASGNVVTANHYYLQLARLSPPDLAGLACANDVGGNTTPFACRRPVFHPSGALLFTSACAEDGTKRSRILAMNTQAPGAGVVTVDGIDVPPGECREIPLVGYAPVPDSIPIRQLEVDDDGLIYFDGVDANGREGVYVRNTTSAAVTIGSIDVPAGATAQVAGPFGDAQTGPELKEKWPVVQPLFPDLSSHLAITLWRARKVLVVAVPLRFNHRVWACHLGQGDAAETFAGKVIPQAAEGSKGALLMARGNVEGQDPAVRFEFDIREPGAPVEKAISPPVNAIEADAAGNLILARGSELLFVSREPAAGQTLSHFGVEVRPPQPAVVYDTATRRGLPITRPLALASRGEDILFFSDDQSIQAVNLTSRDAEVAGAKVDAGAYAVIGAADGARALAFDGVAGLLVADTEADRVRVINLGSPGTGGPIIVAGVTIGPGRAETVVGAPSPGCGGAPPGLVGDGGRPQDALLCRPAGVAVRLRDGFIFIADTLHHRIRAVNPGVDPVQVGSTLVPGHTIMTVVGDGTDVPDAGDEPGPGHVSEPTALSVDDELLFFADAGNPRIRVLNTSAADVAVGGIVVPPGAIRTLVGNGTRGFAGDGGQATAAQVDAPQGLFVHRDPGGRRSLYFTDTSGAFDVVRRVDLRDNDPRPATDSTGIITTVNSPAANPLPRGAPVPAGLEGVSPRDVTLAQPHGLVGIGRIVDGEILGNLFVADTANRRVVRFALVGGSGQ